MSKPNNASEPTIPLSTVVDWLNEHAASTDEEAEVLQLLDETGDAEPVSEAESTRRERQLGGLIARQTLLKDFSGLLEAQSHMARGDLDELADTGKRPNSTE